MLTSLSLRLRIFLFFAALALGALAITCLALWQGYNKGGGSAGFIQAGVISGFGILGLSAGVWLLFDENVAKPIERLAAQMRVRAHGGVEGELDKKASRFLGDLAPAAEAVTDGLAKGTYQTAQSVALATEKLASERERLEALLSDIPVAMIMVSEVHKIVLYDSQSANALKQIAQPRLHSSIFDYLDETSLRLAHKQMIKSGKNERFKALGVNGDCEFDAVIQPLGEAKGYMLVLENSVHLSEENARALVYDFDLLDDLGDGTLQDKPLQKLTFTVFDTETTGLLPHKDEIVQIGAVRIVNGKLIDGEVINTLVDPDMPIPATSTKIHGISDAMVRGAPPITEAARDFHTFASGSVIMAHNAPFDMAFLRRHAKQTGVEWTNPILDTVLLSAITFGQSEEHTLDALCERLNITIEPRLRHTALGDAIATAQVMCALLPMLEARGFDTLGKLLAESRKHGRLLDDANA
ncbi:exonuclease domain-containing protein [Planktotalea sp.]|uniref:3'-5' exonuclease n=1 Tax=Planktotalea sp. TaxID=2029877 RepID=UPI003D6C04A6